MNVTCTIVGYLQYLTSFRTVGSPCLECNAEINSIALQLSQLFCEWKTLPQPTRELDELVLLYLPVYCNAD